MTIKDTNDLAPNESLLHHRIEKRSMSTKRRTFAFITLFYETKSSARKRTMSMMNKRAQQTTYLGKYQISNESRYHFSFHFQSVVRRWANGRERRSVYTNENCNLLRDRDPNTIFRYSARSKKDHFRHWPYSMSPLSSASIRLLRSPPKQEQKIAENPFKILDAPKIQDDFYLNLVDWSSTNILAVGLDTSVYLWFGNTGQAMRLCDLQFEWDLVTSVSWSERAQFLAVGTYKGKTQSNSFHINQPRNICLGLVQIWDAAAKRKVVSFARHTARAGALAWNQHSICSGSRDGFIIHNDIRSNQQLRKLGAHGQEVCGLKWSPDKRLLATGGNDNRLFIWNQTSTKPLLTYKDHQAAVKAIAWSPHQQGILASGGGTADRIIRFWNTSTGSSLHSVDSGSQVRQSFSRKISLFHNFRFVIWPGRNMPMNLFQR